MIKIIEYYKTEMIRLFILGLITVIWGCNKFTESRQFDSLFRITTIGEQKQSQSNLTDFNKCMNDLKYALSPGGIDLLGQMLLNSAKFINQYGDPDACRDNPNTEYVILKVMGIPIGLEIGIWAPAGWDSQEVYKK